MSVGDAVIDFTNGRKVAVEDSLWMSPGAQSGSSRPACNSEAELQLTPPPRSPLAGSPMIDLALDVDFNDSLEFDALCDALSPLPTSRQNHIGSVVDGVLYVAGYKDLCDPRETDARGIRAYLCVAKEVTLLPHVGLEEVERGDVAFLHLPLADSSTTQLQDHFPTVFAFIDENREAGRPVAIYCQQGKSRSVSFALAYLMHASKVTFDDALRQLRSSYERADPNFFFLHQLEEWQHLTQ